MKKNSTAANLLQRTTLIIWVKIFMQHKFCFKAVDQTLQDIHSNVNVLFKRLSTVLEREFAQILPVVRNDNQANIVLAYLQKLSVWPQL